jgi:uncharacterized protein YggT (Ycf19 family)
MSADEEKLATDEANRTVRHETIKGEVREGVQQEITRHARPADDSDQARAAVVGHHLKEKALAEVEGTEAEIDRARVAARVSQVIDYVFYVIYGLIGLEILLELLGARESNAFKNLIDNLSAPLLAPFNTLMPDLGAGRFQFRVAYVVALFVYLLLHLAINGLLRMMVHRKTIV